MSHNLFNLTTALHVSCVTITHVQEHKTTAFCEIFFNKYCDISYLMGLFARFSPQRPRLNSNVQFVE